MTLVDFLGIALSIDTIRAVVQILSLISSFTSIVVTQIFGRKAFVRWRRELGITQGFLWFSIVLCLIELFQPISFNVNGIIIKNLGTKLGTAVWVFGLINLMKIFYKIATLENIQFNKPQIKLENFGKGFNVPCIDDVLDQAKKEGKKLFYPILLVADESCRPWTISQKFVINGLINDCGVVYFTFTRPASHIYNQLEEISKLEKIDLKNQYYRNLVIIDCYSPLTMRERNIKLPLTVMPIDPRNPHFLNKAYENALKLLCGCRLRDKIILSIPLSRRHSCDKIRVVYDTLSDFLVFTDQEVASQYLRHNMVWEEENNVESLYAFRTGTIEKRQEEYTFWFANTLINLEAKEHKILMTIRGLFREPKKFDVDFEFNLIKK